MGRRRRARTLNSQKITMAMTITATIPAMSSTVSLVGEARLDGVDAPATLDVDLVVP